MSKGGIFAMLAAVLAGMPPEEKEAVVDRFKGNGHRCALVACKKDPSGFCHCNCRVCREARGNNG